MSYGTAKIYKHTHTDDSDQMLYCSEHGFLSNWLTCPVEKVAWLCTRLVQKATSGRAPRRKGAKEALQRMVILGKGML